MFSTNTSNWLTFVSILLLEQHNPYHDSHLLLLIAEGDESAYRKLYERYAEKVFSIAYYYLKSHSNAQDIVQEVFLKVWIKRADLPEIENFNGWLHLVTRNMIIDGLRKKAKEGGIIADYNAKDEKGPEQIVMAKETNTIIRDAIESLSPRQKEIYLLARQEGLKHQEIGEHLGLSPQTVREHMKQALRNIRTYLNKHLGMFVFLLFHHL